MFGINGMKASEVIARLQELQAKHGDLIVCGTDGEYGYPEGVTGIRYQPKDNSKLYDKECFRL